MQNKLSGYKTTIIKILEKVYGEKYDLVASNKINKILKFFNDVPGVWEMLTSDKVFNYKPVNDERIIDNVKEEALSKEYVLRHICETILADKEKSSKLQQVLFNVMKLYNFEGVTPSGRKYIGDYYRVMDRVAEYNSRREIQSTLGPTLKAEIDCHRKRINEEIMKACNEDKISLADADAIIKVGAFIADVFVSYYTNKKTKYMDTNFKKCPKFSSIKWFMFKYKF
mgnify:CR=1 FL=1